MADGFWIVVFFVLVVAAYVLSKVIFYMRKSADQWEAVDKSKLKEWEDDDW